MTRTIGPIDTDGQLVVYNPDNAKQVRQVTGTGAPQWAALSTATFSECVTAFVEEGATEHYFADLPAGLDAGRNYPIRVYTTAATGFDGPAVLDSGIDRPGVPMAGGNLIATVSGTPGDPTGATSFDITVIGYPIPGPLSPGDVVRVGDELMLILSGSQTVSVRRNYRSTITHALADNDPIYLVYRHIDTEGWESASYGGYGRVIAEPLAATTINDPTVNPFETTCVLTDMVFRVGDVIRPKQQPELMLVTGVSGLTLTVARQYRGTSLMLLTDNLVLELVSRVDLTLNASGQVQAGNMRGTDDAALASDYTSARAAYLDNLNLGGLAASQADVAAVTQAQRVRISIPSAIERPDTGSLAYRIWIYVYNEQHKAEDLDSTPTVTAANHAGTDRSANLGVVTKPAATTGQYYVDYTLDATDDIEQLVIQVTATEGAQATAYAASMQVVDTTAVDFTAADRTKLDALHDSRLTATRAANLDNLDRAISAAETNIRGADADTLKTLSDQIDTVTSGSTTVDGVSLASLREMLLAFLAGKATVVDNGDATKTISFLKQDGATVKHTVTFDAAGQHTATEIDPA